MDDRYPYIRFVIDAGQVIAGAVVVIVLLAGTVSSCRHGGFGGLFSFLVTVAVAAVAYIVVMVRVEALRVFLDIENSTRESLAARRQSPEAAPPGTAS